MRLPRLLVVVLVGVLLAAAAALSVAMAGIASSSKVDVPRRLVVGFQDDPAFRWDADRAVQLDRARQANARVIRTFIDWSVAAPERPRRAADPFDPAYRLEDVDDLVRQAQSRGMDVLVTIWGTPPWANGNTGRNRLPSRLADLTAFAKAISTRYSGRFAAQPRVRYWSVWNEPNLEQFLAPQFDARGRSVAPALYARLYRAAYAGIKAGNRQALVGIGETSPWGRDRLGRGTTQETHSPARFAQLVAEADRSLRFDAWAHHPYPTSLGLPPEQRTRWPNVSLTALPRFEESLNRWFGREETPIWITEYGYQTRRPAAFGVTNAQQAAYGVRALQIAAATSSVEMFVWFVLRDSESTPWRSGLFDLQGRAKPAYARFGAAAGRLDASDAVVRARPGNGTVTLPVEALSLAATNGVGSPVGVTWRAYLGKRLVAVDQERLALGIDGRVVVPAAWARKAGSLYRVVVEVGDPHGRMLERTLQVAVA